LTHARNSKLPCLGLFPGQFLRTSYSLFKVLTQEKAAKVAPSRCSEIPQLLFTLQVIPIFLWRSLFLYLELLYGAGDPSSRCRCLFYGNYDVSSGYVIPDVKDLEFGKKGRELELAN
jgi:hypothetical protein